MQKKIHNTKNTLIILGCAKTYRKTPITEEG